MNIKCETPLTATPRPVPKMRSHFFPRDAMRWREELQMGARLQAVSDTHKRELEGLERTLGRRVEAAERLLSLILFEQEAARRQIKVLAREVRGLREAVLVVSRAESPASVVSKPSSVAGWVDVDE